MVFWFIIEHTMLPIFCLVLLGFFVDRHFHLDIKTLSKFMFYAVIPSFIFTNVYTTEFPAASTGIIAALAIFMVLSFLIACAVGKWRHYDEGMMQSCRNALMFNNTGNLGVALIILVFSHDPFVVNGQTPYLAEAMVVQIIIFILQSISLNTLGLYQAGRGRLSARDTLKVMMQMPLIYFLLAALGARMTGFDAKDFFLWPIMEMAGHAILPLAMFSIGAQLSQTKIHWLDKDVWIISILKMTVLPMIGLLMIYTANAILPGTFTAVSATVFLIYCAIPTAVNTALFAIEFDNNADYATQIVMNTTALSALSLTFYIFLGHLLFV
ncbi:AEC family transporter [uncultured Megasphaera sp.]|uniref:AEC family transporter n=1 Tax=uncultured Megasphaera sp. TaxID=165188 RepID=UPI00265B4597|nr:AEC family transporter [uncultured Megasphaera sp.]